MKRIEINKTLDALFAFLKGEVSVCSIEATQKRGSNVVKVEIHFFNKKNQEDSLDLRTEDFKTFEVWSFKTDRKAKLGFSPVKKAEIRV